MSDNKKNIAIFGSGNICKRMYPILRELFQIEFCFDNDEKRWGTFVYGIPIQKWTKNGLFIIITIEAWEEIATQLEEKGLRFGHDYIPYLIYLTLNYATLYDLRKNFLQGKYLSVDIDYTSFLPDRKLAVAYGNCQTMAVEKVLMVCKDFREEYIVLKTPKVFEYLSNLELVEFFLDDKAFWKTVDLFIYQGVKKENKYHEKLSTDRIISMLKRECQLVHIVNLCFFGYFPQVEQKNSEWEYFSFCDKYVDSMLRDGLSKEMIIKKISDDTFIAENEIVKCINDSISELKMREAKADVKIADYIEGNYREEQLFYSALHPCNRLYKEYMKRIFKYLGLEWDLSEEEFMFYGGVCKGFDFPIYPSVVRYLGLKEISRPLLSQNFPQYMLLDFEQCMDLYIDVKLFSV